MVQEVLSESFSADVQKLLKVFREELDEHRECINENSQELEYNFSYLREIDEKLEKLNARIDELFLLVSGKTTAEEPKIRPLTKTEKDVFAAIYRLGAVLSCVSYKQIAKQAGISEGMVSSYITALVEKGVPVVKKLSGGVAYVQLKPEFRELQARKNIVGLDAPLSSWIR